MDVWKEKRSQVGVSPYIKDEKCKNTGDGPKTANLTVTDLHALCCEPGQVYMAGKFNNSGDILLDSGTMSHMFFDPSFFVTYTPVTASSDVNWIAVGDAHSIHLAGRGTVKFQM